MKVLSNKQYEEFVALTRPLIEWLNANCHPHVKVTVDPVGAELHEGVAAYMTDEFLRD